MLAVIGKHEYWEWLDAGLRTPTHEQLKAVQDLYILSRLRGVSGCRILEAGGGNSRVLTQLATNNECWNADKLEGHGNGPTEDENAAAVRVVSCFLGEFSDRLPSGVFDYVFSISVVEHLADDFLEPFFLDCARLLKPSGLCLHAIDTYLFDRGERRYGAGIRARLGRYLEIAARSDLGMLLVEPPSIVGDLCYSCHFASNPDSTMYNWSKRYPQMRALRENGQNVSLKLEWRKPDTQSPL